MSRNYNLNEAQEKVLKLLQKSRMVVSAPEKYGVYIADKGTGLYCDGMDFANLIQRGLIRNLYGNVYIATQLEMF